MADVGQEDVETLSSTGTAWNAGILDGGPPAPAPVNERAARRARWADRRHDRHRDPQVADGVRQRATSVFELHFEQAGWRHVQPEPALHEDLGARVLAVLLPVLGACVRLRDE